MEPAIPVQGIMRTVGVITLANDAVLPWFEAWAASLRAWNRDLEVVVLPFDGHCDRVSKLCKRMGFSMSNVPLDRWQGLANELYPENRKARAGFRKLGAFEERFETFLFLDVDIVVLSDLSDILETFDRSEFDLAYFDRDLDTVYLPGALRDRFVSERGSVGFNAGAFVARKRSLSWDEACSRMEEYLELRAQFPPLWEQPFLNYFYDSGEMSIADVRSLFPWIGRTWAGFPDLAASGNVAEVLGETTGTPEIISPIVHWAGRELKWVMPYAKIYRRYATSGTKLRLLGKQAASGVRRRIRRLGDAIAAPGPSGT